MSSNYITAATATAADTMLELKFCVTAYGTHSRIDGYVTQSNEPFDTGHWPDFECSQL